jgi:hypothetical protein
MKATEVFGIAVHYVESIKDRNPGDGLYADALERFAVEAMDAEQADYRLFRELVHMLTRHVIDLRMTEAVAAFPEWPKPAIPPCVRPGGTVATLKGGW